MDRPMRRPNSARKSGAQVTGKHKSKHQSTASSVHTTTSKTTTTTNTSSIVSVEHMSAGGSKNAGTRTPAHFEESVRSYFEHPVRKMLQMRGRRSVEQQHPLARSGLTIEQCKAVFSDALHKSELLNTQWADDDGDSEGDEEDVEGCRSNSITSPKQKQKTLMCEALFREAVPIHFSPGDVLFETGSYGQLLYVVITGQLEEARQVDVHPGFSSSSTSILRQQAVGHRHSRSSASRHNHRSESTHGRNSVAVKTRIVSPGETLAVSCLLMRAAHTSTVRAKTKGTLLAIHRLQYQVAAMKVNLSVASMNITTASARVPELLCQVPMLAALTSTQREHITSLCEHRHYVPGERICRAGGSNPGLYIIIKGEVLCRSPISVFSSNSAQMGSRQLFDDASNHEISWLRSGDHFGESSLFEDESDYETGHLKRGSVKSEVSNSKTSQADDPTSPLSSQKKTSSQRSAHTGVSFLAGESMAVECLVLPRDKFINFAKGKSAKQAPILELVRHLHHVRLLERNPLFESLTTEQINELASHAKPLHFTDESSFEGDLSEKWFYLITSGAVRVQGRVGGESEDISKDQEDREGSSSSSDGGSRRSPDPDVDYLKRHAKGKCHRSALMFVPSSSKKRRSHSRSVSNPLSKIDSVSTMALVNDIPETSGSGYVEINGSIGGNERKMMDEGVSMFQYNSMLADVTSYLGNSNGDNENSQATASIKATQAVTTAAQAFKVNIKNKNKNKNKKVMGTGTARRLQFASHCGKPQSDLEGSESHVHASLGPNTDTLRLPARDESLVLLEGDVLGESALTAQLSSAGGGRMQGNNQHTLAYTALGRVTCLRISLKHLVSLHVLCDVRATFLQSKLPEEEESKTELTSASAASITSSSVVLHGSKSSDQFSSSSPMFASKFLALGSMIHDSLYSPKVQDLLSSLTRDNLSIVRTLHHTDMTHVWLAIHTPSCQLCVVKGVDTNVANEQGSGKLMLAETSILSQLHSPFVVELLRTWEEPNKVVVALEPILGGDLEHAINLAIGRSAPLANTSSSSLSVPPSGDRGCLTFEHCRFNAACAVLALKHLFEHRVCHRDIKPCNMMVDHLGYVKLADFGISKQFLAGSGRTFTAVGTPNYMAPELLTFNGYGCSADWWALGATLFEMAVGHNPFEDGPFSAPLSFGVSRFRILEYFHRSRMAYRSEHSRRLSTSSTTSKKNKKRSHRVNSNRRSKNRSSSKTNKSPSQSQPKQQHVETDDDTNGVPAVIVLGGGGSHSRSHGSHHKHGRTSTRSGVTTNTGRPSAISKRPSVTNSSNHNRNNNNKNNSSSGDDKVKMNKKKKSHSRNSSASSGVSEASSIGALPSDKIFNPLLRPNSDSRSPSIVPAVQQQHMRWNVFGDLVTGLMSGLSYARLGDESCHDGPRGVLDHPLFAGDAEAGLEPFDWAALTSRRMEAPYVPLKLLLDSKEAVALAETTAAQAEPGLVHKLSTVFGGGVNVNGDGSARHQRNTSEFSSAGTMISELAMDGSDPNKNNKFQRFAETKAKRMNFERPSLSQSKAEHLGDQELLVAKPENKIKKNKKKNGFKGMFGLLRCETKKKQEEDDDDEDDDEDEDQEWDELNARSTKKPVLQRSSIDQQVRVALEQDRAGHMRSTVAEQELGRKTLVLNYRTGAARMGLKSKTARQTRAADMLAVATISEAISQVKMGVNGLRRRVFSTVHNAHAVTIQRLYRGRSARKQVQLKRTKRHKLIRETTELFYDEERHRKRENAAVRIQRFFRKKPSKSKSTSGGRGSTMKIRKKKTKSPSSGVVLTEDED